MIKHVVVINSAIKEKLNSNQKKKPKLNSMFSRRKSDKKKHNSRIIKTDAEPTFPDLEIRKEYLTKLNKQPINESTMLEKEFRRFFFTTFNEDTEYIEKQRIVTQEMYDSSRGPFS